MYTYSIPVDAIRKILGQKWNLGEVFVTEGVSKYVSSHKLDIYSFISSHLNEEYGEISLDPVDLKRNQTARQEGRPFTSFFNIGNDYLKIVTNPMLGRTVLCLARED